jgi:hypothetical protein
LASYERRLNGRCLEVTHQKRGSNRRSVYHSLQVMDFSPHSFQLLVVVSGQGAVSLLLEVSDLNLKLGLIKTLYFVVDVLVNS